MGIASYAAASSPQLGENARCISLPSIAVTGVGVVARIVNAVISGALATTRTAALVFGLFFTLPGSAAIDTITSTVTSLVPANIGNMSFISLTESAGHAHGITVGCAQHVQQGGKRLQVDLAPAVGAEQFESPAAELAEASTLSCSQQNDKRV